MVSTDEAVSANGVWCAGSHFDGVVFRVLYRYRPYSWNVIRRADF